jgi:hypothetical protein
MLVQDTIQKDNVNTELNYQLNHKISICRQFKHDTQDNSEINILPTYLNAQHMADNTQ